MTKRLAWAMTVFVGLLSTAWACGPFFPWQVLGDRQAVLRAAPANSFVFELGRILKRKPAELHPPVAEDYDQLQKDQDSPDTDISVIAKAANDASQQSDMIAAANAAYAYRRFNAERVGLTENQIGVLALARTKPDGAAVYSAAADLPEPIRLYLAGAVEFDAKHTDRALGYFQSVLALPDKSRAVWAEFMIGRGKAAAGDEKAAIAAFRKTRSLAQQGDPDPLDLADASYGEEALLPLEQARSLAKSPTDAAAPNYGAAISRALRLYGEAALQGSRENLDSTVVTLKEVLADRWTIRAAVWDPMVRDLLVVFVAARMDDLPEDGSPAKHGDSLNPPAPRSAIPEENDRLHLPGVQVGSPTEISDLLDAIGALGDPQSGDADRLAALAYRAGRYDVAARAAKLTTSPIASWVLAKLALRAGDTAEAARRYAEAAAAFPARLSDIHFAESDDFFQWQHEVDQTNGDLDGNNRALLEGERSILALSRGEYATALDLLYPAAPLYWGDVAYIAERVLTTDELRGFVDQSVPAPVADADGTFHDPKADAAMRLRWLLARRLFRDRRYDDALTYFPRAGSPELIIVGQSARDYAKAMQTAAAQWFPSKRAKPLFDAATLARDSGMELLGTEGPPDEHLNDGEFDIQDFGDFRGTWNAKTEAEDFGPSGQASASEAARVNSTSARPNQRYHYRYVAADLAEQAAAAVPARSQAYAALLCHATQWASRDPAATEAIYHRYVTNGAILPWTKHFGSDCPAPNFDTLGTARWWSIKHQIRQLSPGHSLKLAAGMVILVAAAGTAVLVWMVRRRRQGTPAP